VATDALIAIGWVSLLVLVDCRGSHCHGGCDPSGRSQLWQVFAAM